MFVTLIVEDNAIFRRSLKDLLLSHFPHMQIEEAVDGMEAFQKVESLLPDLVFMDIRLPGVNGLEVTKKIRARFEQMVVVVLTSHDLPEYREAAYRSGAGYFFTKGSATGDEIVSVVGSLMSKNGNGNASFSLCG